MSSHPYPGLRPYRADEVDIFFGREGQIDEQLVKLEGARFLAVIGPSGCGKSSLVRTGLLDALTIGFMTTAGTRWRIADLRPGDAPMWQLASALFWALKRSGSKELSKKHVDDIVRYHATLSRGIEGLAELLDEDGREDGGNLLLLVDQFEELFRFREAREVGVSRDEAQQESADFVRLLLDAARQRERPIYVILTMRTGFLDQCYGLEGLPVAINQSQFMVPLLTADQLSRAIVGPARVHGGQVTQGLLDRLIADVGPSTDVLPLLQHALMRTWNEALLDGGDAPVLMTLEHYGRTGGLAQALSRHADEALADLARRDPQNVKLAEIMFRELTDRPPGMADQDIRRPRHVSDVAQVAGLTGKDEWRRLVPVIEAFRAPGRSFVHARTRMDASGAPSRQITPTTILDISHESLIRQWRTLSGWVDKEARQAGSYADLVRACEEHSRGKADILGNLQVRHTRKWWNASRPTANWAARYPGDFAAAEGFLRKSERRRQWNAVGLQGGVLVALFLAWLAIFYWASDRNKEEYIGQIEGLNQELATAREKAEEVAEEAQAQKTEAEVQAERAERGETAAKEQAALALEAARLEGNARREADKQRKIAQEKTAALEKEQATTKMLYLLNQAAILSLRARSLIADDRLDEGLLLSLEALRLGGGSEALTSLLTGLQEAAGLTTTLGGHQDWVRSVAFSPNADLLASASDDGTIRLWDTITQETTASLEGHSGYVTAIAFSPDGGLLASVGDDGTIRLWDLATREQRQLGETRKKNGEPSRIWGLAFSPDGATLATADWEIRLWDIATGELRCPPLVDHHKDVYAVAFDPEDGNTLASGGGDGQIRLWDVGSCSPARLPLQHGEEAEVQVRALAFGKRFLASGGTDDSIRLWDSEEYDLIGDRLTGHAGDVLALAFNRSGTLLASGSEDVSIRLWDMASRQPTGQPLTGHGKAVRSVAFDSTGKTLASGSDDRTVKLWDPRQLGTALKAHDEFVLAVAFNPKNDTLASASADKTVRLWDAGSHPPQALGDPMAHHQGWVRGLAFSPDGTVLASGSQDGSIVLWNAELARLENELEGQDEGVLDLAFSHDGRYLASAGLKGTIHLWDLHAGKAPVKTLDGRTDAVRTVAFSPDDKILAFTGDDFVIRLWDVENDRQLEPLTGHNREIDSLAFQPFDRGKPKESQKLILASGSGDYTIRFWDVAAGEQLGEPLEGHSGVVRAVAFSPDGQQLASGGGDNTARLWNVKTHEPIGRPFEGHTNHVTSLVFSPDGETLVSASDDGSLRLWDLDAESWKMRACRLANRDLTDSEWAKFVPPGIEYHRTCTDLDVEPAEPATGADWAPPAGAPSQSTP